MRTREEIFKELNAYNSKRKIHIRQNRVIVELLLDIRDLLKR